MRILLYDTTAYQPASPLYLEALDELASVNGWHWRFFDEAPYLRRVQESRLHRAVYKLFNRRPLSYWKLNHDFLAMAVGFKPDVIIVCKGAYLSADTLAKVRQQTHAILINYATDDPWNPQASTADLRAAIGQYDLYACTKRAIMDDVRAAGAKEVIYLPFGYKPNVHYPELPESEAERDAFTSDVVFLGGCDDDRVPYFSKLIETIPGLRLHLYGGYWQKHKQFRRYYRGFALGRHYRLAISSTKIAINLVRKANRDGHVMRSFEIPACGAFMLAERTMEHVELFEEDKEVTYFGSPKELVDKVCFYLCHDRERHKIAQAGFGKVTLGGHRYTDRLKTMLKAADVLRNKGDRE